ncbi:MAG: TRAP transporter small permease [Pseudomonadota bacterium]
MKPAALLAVFDRIERIACLLAFALMAAALMFDVGARLVRGSGVLGAPQAGVIGMIAVSMFGMGLASSAGEHLRPNFLDGIWPKGWSRAAFQAADATTGLFFALFAVIAALVVAESYGLGDVTSVLRWPVWPLQSLIVAAFSLNAVRYFIFALNPDLRPHGIADGVADEDVAALSPKGEAR